MNETFTDDTQRYLDLVIEEVVNVIDTGGGGGDKPSANEIAMVERTLTKADYPTITEVGDGAFSYCPLTSVNFPEAKTLRAMAFYSTPLTTFTFPKVKHIRSDCFGNNDTIKEITPDNFPVLEKLHSRAFRNMYALEKADFAKLTSIGVQCFFGCEALQTLILRNEKMVTLMGAEWFYDTPIGQGTGSIYVPDALVDTYKADANWSTYADQIKPLSEL